MRPQTMPILASRVVQGDVLVDPHIGRRSVFRARTQHRVTEFVTEDGRTYRAYPRQMIVIEAPNDLPRTEEE
jgi:hypothetical protein